MFVFVCSLPFPVDADEGAAADGDRPGPRHPPHSGKGLSQEQKQGLEMVRQVMTSLDEEDGLDEVHVFRYRWHLACGPVSKQNLHKYVYTSLI